jgi:hypothetical protein
MLRRVFLPVRIMVGIRVGSTGAVVTGAVVVTLLTWLQCAIIRKIKGPLLVEWIEREEQ